MSFTPIPHKIYEMKICRNEECTTSNVDYYIIEEEGKYYFSNKREREKNTQPVCMYPLNGTFTLFLDSTTVVIFKEEINER